MEHTKFWKEFLQLYKEMPSLWRVGSIEYSDRVLKAKCYERLVEKLKIHYPNADREMVVKKINNFRTSYRKEVKRLKECQEAGKDYKPTLWYFNCLKFLDDLEEISANQISFDDGNTQEPKERDHEESTNSVITLQLSSKRSRTSLTNNEEKNIPSSTKRSKMLHYKQLDSPKMSPEDKHQAKIDSEILARSWAIQYREMNSKQKLIARKIISDILFHGCLENLNMSHTNEVQDILLRKSNSSRERPSYSPEDSNDSSPLNEQEFVDINESHKEPSLNYNSSSSCDSPQIVSSLELNDMKIENMKVN